MGTTGKHELHASLGTSVQNVKSSASSIMRTIQKKPALAAGVGAGAIAAVCVVLAAVFGLPEWVGAKPALAELAKAAKKNPKNANLQVELGHALFDARSPGAALRAYDRGLRLDPDVASGRLTANLVACYGKPEQVAAHNIIVKYKLTDAEDQLDDLTRHKTWRVRTGAIETLERIGKASQADHLNVWTMDLKAEDCEIRRHAVEKLGELGDKAALDAIRAAAEKDKADTFLFSCLGDRPEDAQKKIFARN